MRKAVARRASAAVTPDPRWREALSSERMAHLIKDAFRGTSRALQDRLKQHAVAYAHWTLLRVLWQTDGITQRQLSEQAGVTEPSTFSALQRMEKLGYVTRQKMRSNGKEVRVFVAPKGAALRRSIVAAAEEVNRVALAGLPAADVETTRRTLLAMIGNLSDRHSGSAMAAGRTVTRARAAAGGLHSSTRALDD